MPDSNQPEWAERVLLDELRRQARRTGVKDTERLSRDDLVKELRTRRPTGRRDPYAPTRDPD